MAYERRGFSETAEATRLSGDINDTTNTIPCLDLSSWSGINSNGPSVATINRGQADEETVTFTGIATNSLTGVTRSVANAQAHASGATVEHTTGKRDFDEANAHIADTTLDHHSQYAKTDGSRTITGMQTITRGTAGTSLTITKEAASLQAGSILLNRAANKPASLVFAGAIAVNMGIGVAASSDDLEIGTYNGASYTKRFVLCASGSLQIGDGSALPTNATTGFLGLRYMAGTPTGSPDIGAGAACAVYDSSANKLWIYNAGWRSVTLT